MAKFRRPFGRKADKESKQTKDQQPRDLEEDIIDLMDIVELPGEPSGGGGLLNLEEDLPEPDTDAGLGGLGLAAEPWEQDAGPGRAHPESVSPGVTPADEAGVAVETGAVAETAEAVTAADRAATTGPGEPPSPAASPPPASEISPVAGGERPAEKPVPIESIAEVIIESPPPPPVETEPVSAVPYAEQIRGASEVDQAPAFQPRVDVETAAGEAEPQPREPETARVVPAAAPVPPEQDVSIEMHVDTEPAAAQAADSGPDRFAAEGLDELPKPEDSGADASPVKAHEAAAAKPIDEPEPFLVDFVARIEHQLSDMVREIVEARLPEIVRQVLREEIERMRSELERSSGK